MIFNWQGTEYPTTVVMPLNRMQHLQLAFTSTGDKALVQFQTGKDVKKH